MVRLSDYKTIIVDLDGTLYFQNHVRASMLCLMLRHPFRIKDFLVVRKYRRLYASGYGESERLARLPSGAAEIIDEWMIRRPLPFVRKHRDSQLIDALKKVQNEKIRVAVYSDYPVAEKLAALQFSAKETYDADGVGTMKPDAAGIVKAMNLAEEDVKDILIIGDRDDKDGQLARNIGCDYLILGKTKNERRKQYEL